MGEDIGVALCCSGEWRKNNARHLVVGEAVCARRLA
jgi:hypothetical protein